MVNISRNHGEAKCSSTHAIVAEVHVLGRVDRASARSGKWRQPGPKTDCRCGGLSGRITGGVQVGRERGVRTMEGRVRIGTSGWVYAHWRGVFYPSGLAQSRWFAHYSTQFGTVEINNTFYRLPGEGVFDRWREQAPADFVYAVKSSRFITHVRRLADAAASVNLILSRARRLGSSLGPILYQLPPNWPANPRRLAEFASLLPPDLSHVFEFRDADWFQEPIRRDPDPAWPVFLPLRPGGTEDAGVGHRADRVRSFPRLIRGGGPLYPRRADDLGGSNSRLAGRRATGLRLFQQRCLWPRGDQCPRVAAHGFTLKT